MPGNDFEWAANFSFKIPSITRPLARLRSGFLINEILDRFSQKIGSTLSPDRSVWIYSGHDTTLAGVLNTLELFEVILFYCVVFFSFCIQNRLTHISIELILIANICKKKIEITKRFHLF